MVQQKSFLTPATAAVLNIYIQCNSQNYLFTNLFMNKLVCSCNNTKHTAQSSLLTNRH